MSLLVARIYNSESLKPDFLRDAIVVHKALLLEKEDFKIIFQEIEYNADDMPNILREFSIDLKN